MSKRRRTNPANKFVMIERWFWRCPAWQALPHAARSLYIELELRFTGTNNGEIELSVRKAATLLACSIRFACKMFAELEAKGFIKARERGSFGWKARHSTTWILTLHEYLGREPTKSFMQWTQPEIQKPVSRGDTDGITGGYRGRPKTPATVSPGDTERADSGGRSVSPGDTVLVYHPVPFEESAPEGRAALPK